MDHALQNIQIRSQEDLLAHVLSKNISTFFIRLYNDSKLNKSEISAFKFHFDYLIPLEIMIIATLYPAYLGQLRLQIRDNKIVSPLLERTNKKLIEEGYFILDKENLIVIGIMPLNIAEKQYFPLPQIIPLKL